MPKYKKIDYEALSMEDRNKIQNEFVQVANVVSFACFYYLFPLVL